MKKIGFLIFLFFSLTQIAGADQVINENLIVRANVCAGNALCTNGQSFLNNIGQADLNIKSYQPLILFEDAIWDDFAIEATENEFNIYNEDSNVRIVGIDNNAEADSIYIGDVGNIGLFTNTPTSNIELTVWAESGSIAEIRLQDSSQSWDVELASNDDFQVQDITSNTTPFTIQNGAPTNSLVLDSDGSLNLLKGIAEFSGSNSTGDGLSTLFEMSAMNTAAGKVSDVGFLLDNAGRGFQWAFRTLEPTTGFSATKVGTGGSEMKLNNTTNNFRNVSLQLGNGAVCNSSGQWIDASSRDYKDNISDLSGQKALETLEQLTPVMYTLKRDKKKEINVGFIAEDLPELVATKDRKGMSSTEVVAVLTKVLKEQQETITKLIKRIDQLERQ